MPVIPSASILPEWMIVIGKRMTGRADAVVSRPKLNGIVNAKNVRDLYRKMTENTCHAVVDTRLIRPWSRQRQIQTEESGSVQKYLPDVTPLDGGLWSLH